MWMRCAVSRFHMVRNSVYTSIIGLTLIVNRYKANESEIVLNIITLSTASAGVGAAPERATVRHCTPPLR